MKQKIKHNRFSFYEKQRLTEKKLELNFESVHCEDIGLHVIGKYPRLQFGNFNFSEGLDWRNNAEATIRLTILNLINNDVIEVVKVLDSKTYFFKLFKSYHTNYYFKIIDLQVDKDWFSVMVYKTINEVNQTDYPDLYDYINEIIGKILNYQSHFNNPSRTFLIEILRTYTKKFKWIELIKTKKLLGLIDDFNLKVEDIYIPRISMQHQSLTDIDNNLFRLNNDYKDFYKALNDEISYCFRKRKNDD